MSTELGRYAGALDVRASARASGGAMKLSNGRTKANRVAVASARFGGAIALLSGAAWFVASATAPSSALATTPSYELYCPGTPVGDIVLERCRHHRHHLARSACGRDPVQPLRLPDHRERSHVARVGGGSHSVTPPWPGRPKRQSTRRAPPRPRSALPRSPSRSRSRPRFPPPGSP